MSNSKKGHKCLFHLESYKDLGGVYTCVPVEFFISVCIDSFLYGWKDGNK
jgi:hypothetical protein